jgi:hypothetical protein
MNDLLPLERSKVNELEIILLKQLPLLSLIATSSSERHQQL